MDYKAANYKKALGSIRPNEKRVGKAISPPPCERGVPLYPLRYGGWSIQMQKMPGWNSSICISRTLIRNLT